MLQGSNPALIFNSSKDKGLICIRRITLEYSNTLNYLGWLNGCWLKSFHPLVGIKFY